MPTDPTPRDVTDAVRLFVSDEPLQPANESSIVVCPACLRSENFPDGFDVLGADGDNVFCTNCSCEFDPATMEIHRAKQ